LKPRRAVGDLNAQSEVLKKEHDEVAKKLAEKEKEANILTIKLRELHRIARFHSILPPDEDEAFRPNMKVQSAKLQSISSPTSGKFGAQSATYNAKPKLARLESSNNYAKNSLLYNGYRKDDRGKVLNDGPGEHFSDKELMAIPSQELSDLRVGTIIEELSVSKLFIRQRTARPLMVDNMSEILKLINLKALNSLMMII